MNKSVTSFIVYGCATLAALGFFFLMLYMGSGILFLPAEKQTTEYKR
jgi:hypothetical protein